jgi:integrase
MSEEISFTAARLEKITCPAGQERVWTRDAKCPGLQLMTTSAGTKAFYLRRKVNGRSERIRLGEYPALSIDEARNCVARLSGQIASGDNPADDRRARRGEITLDDLFARYIDDYAKAHKRTWQDDQEQFDRYLSEWKSRRLSSITRHDVQTLHATIGKQHKYAANRLLALLSAVYNFAPDIGYAGTNPAKGIKRFRENSRERFLQPDEMPRFLAALDDHPDQLIADVFRVLLFTGARRSNVQAMRWADVSFGSRTWTIPHEQAKGGDAMTVYLSDAALAVLRRRWSERTEGDLYVFPGYGKTGHIVELKAAWKEILNRAKVEGVRVPARRRTYGSWLPAGGASLPMIGKALGHKSQQTTAIYARLNINPIKGIVDTATGAMLATVAAPATAPAKAKTKKRKSA